MTYTMPTKNFDLFIDYEFKKIFGEEPNKGLLFAFLHEVLHPHFKKKIKKQPYKYARISQ